MILFFIVVFLVLMALFSWMFVAVGDVDSDE